SAASCRRTGGIAGRQIRTVAGAARPNRAAARGERKEKPHHEAPRRFRAPPLAPRFVDTRHPCAAAKPSLGRHLRMMPILQPMDATALARFLALILVLVACETPRSMVGVPAHPQPLASLCDRLAPCDPGFGVCLRCAESGNPIWVWSTAPGSPWALRS